MHLLEFSKADIHYLSNVCHNCGACLHACQYAEPHEFAVNVPRALAAVRPETYAEFAWPKKLGLLYKKAGITMTLATAGGIGLIIGPLGLLWMNKVRSPLHKVRSQQPMDLGFITSLLIVSISGLALLM